MIDSDDPSAVATRPIAAPPMRRADGVETGPRSASDSLATEDLPANALPPVRGSSPAHADLAAAPVRNPRRYVFLGEHGRGALGRVSRAHDKELGRDIAIKELIAREHASETRFLREALITARLEHPGIVAVHEAGRWPDGTPFYAMKLVSGRSLKELIAERDTRDERLGLLHHVIAVADAIAYAHRCNVIHRDLKPANIIVGEFGETVVIDWGLAKDLGAPEPSSEGDHAPRPSTDRELTVTGTVLGTPAYMAPEQERGEPVDQRADVFAIGVMLWELCAHSRVLPAQPHLRYRQLRRAGIATDLATIIDKALEADPARRYADAGALAHDLKAFKAGARIAARGYSVLGILAHWFRTHRPLAFSALAALVVATIAMILFVLNIAAARDRADAALQRVAAADNDRILEHVQLLLQTDPTAAVTALADYHGSDVVRARRLLAEAEGRGVARAVFAPHSDVIWFLHGDKTGAVLSVGGDHRIRVTRGTASRTVVDDVSIDVHLAYAPNRGLLAYSNAPAGVSILDLRTLTSQRISAQHPAQLVFTDDGARLAVLDTEGELRVWQTGPEPSELYRATLPGATALAFASSTRLVVLVRGALRTIALDASGGAPAVASVEGVTAVDTQGDAVLAGTSDGRIVMLSSSLRTLGATGVCRRRLRHVQFIPRTELFAFACQDPLAGVARYDAARHEVDIIDTFSTRGLTSFGLDFAGRYVVVKDESSSAYLYDVTTRLVSQYDGNAGMPSYVAAPSAEFDRVLVGDINGAVRVWSAPTRAARVALHAAEPLFGLGFTPDSKDIFIGGSSGVLRRIPTEPGPATELRGHRDLVQSTRVSPDGTTVLSLSDDGTVRSWRVRDLVTTRVFAEHGSAVADAEYVDHGQRVVSVGEDGRLLVWSLEGTDMAVLFEAKRPLIDVEVLAHNGHLVIADAQGAMWDVSRSGERRKLRDTDGTIITALRASSGGDYLALGTSAGTVSLYDTSTWQVIKTIDSPGSIRRLQFDPKGRDLLVISEPGRAQAGHVQLVALGTGRRLAWRDMVADARDGAYSPDGDTLGLVCSDGSAWLYRISEDSWTYTRDHRTKAIGGKFSPDGRLFVSTDIQGFVVVRDLAPRPSRAAHLQEREYR